MPPTTLNSEEPVYDIISTEVFRIFILLCLTLLLHFAVSFNAHVTHIIHLSDLGSLHAYRCRIVQR